MKTKYKTNYFYKINKSFIANMLLALFLALSFSSCKKYLEEKSDQTLVLPKTLSDCNDMLNDISALNEVGFGQRLTASDNYEIPWSTFNSWNNNHKPYYIWDENAPTSWDFSCVLTANTVLDVLDGITPGDEVEQNKWNQFKGEAMFFRSNFFFELLEVFALPYDASTAETDLGIPLRLTTDVNTVTLRSTVQESYDFIIADLTEIIELLPDLPSINTRVSKAAAYGLLSRIYLAMRNYPMALENATNCLNIQDDLYDYNDGAVPSPDYSNFHWLDNPEVIFQAFNDAVLGVWYEKGHVSTDLYNSYETTDLRLDLFFDDVGSGPQMLGTYGFHYYQYFSGIAVDEILLTRAECYARAGSVELAIDDLNTLLEKRFETGTFTPYVFTDYTSVTATQLILQERRKELIFRGLRWMDIRRLNKENDPNYAVGTLTRTFADNPAVTYTLPPNDLRYAFLIPQVSIDMSGLTQNPR